MQSASFRIAAALGISLLSAGAFAQTAQTTTPPSTTPSTNSGATRAFDRAAGTDTSGAYPSQADGTAANPKGTAVGRATNRATRHSPNRNAQNLRNNSASRTLDRAAGTDTSGAYPSQADGTPGNPPGTVVSRTLGTTNK